MGSLDPQGPAARSMADLFWLMTALGTAVFVLVVVLLGVGLFRGRRQRSPAERRTSNPWILWGGVVMPAVIVVVVLVATIASMREVPMTPPDGALVVDVVGHQWWWEVSYPDAGVVTANELHMPLDRPVAIRLTSADVIHSFWVPELGGKLDALPDGTNTLVLEAEQPGEHHTECAEFCGLQHARMGITVVAEEPDRFEDWVRRRSGAARPPDDPDAARGRDVLLASECVRCHTIRGTSAAGETGPDLTHVADRPSIGAGAAAPTAPDLAAWVADPHTMKEGVEMPASDLSDADLRAVVAYLETLE